MVSSPLVRCRLSCPITKPDHNGLLGRTRGKCVPHPHPPLLNLPHPQHPNRSLCVRIFVIPPCTLQLNSTIRYLLCFTTAPTRSIIDHHVHTLPKPLT